MVKPRKVLFPRLGFVTNRSEDPGRPGEQRPERTYASVLYFADYDDETARRLNQNLRIRNDVQLPGGPIQTHYSRFGLLAVVNEGRGGAGFHVCLRCGFSRVVAGRKQIEASHKGPYGSECKGALKNFHLGHEFMTDVVQLDFPVDGGRERRFWLSLLYALLEGASLALNVRRQDLDGCLYAEGGDPRAPAVVLLDNVPGGAGHVALVPVRLADVLQAALERVSGQCGCAEETSCYGCLRNYANQRWHDQLARGAVKEYLERMLARGLR